MKKIGVILLCIAMLITTLSGCGASDGNQATQEIRRLDNRKLADIPIIAMTANAFEKDRQAAMKAGMNDHLAKPIQIEKLYEMMTKYL